MCKVELYECRLKYLFMVVFRNYILLSFITNLFFGLYLFLVLACLLVISQGKVLFPPHIFALHLLFERNPLNNISINFCRICLQCLYSFCEAFWRDMGQVMYCYRASNAFLIVILIFGHEIVGVFLSCPLKSVPVWLAVWQSCFM